MLLVVSSFQSPNVVGVMASKSGRLMCENQVARGVSAVAAIKQTTMAIMASQLFGRGATHM
jgi:hypothetical protein